MRPVYSNSVRNRLLPSLKLRHNKYSTVTSITPQLPRLNSRNAPLLTRTGALTIPSIPAICAARFYSSGSPPPASSSATSNATGVSDTALPTFEELTNSDVLLNIPERIGFLKELGLNFGWGPTAIMENILEHVHVWSGMPWYASIIATAFLMRVALFPLYLKMSDQIAKQRALGSVISPLREKQMQAMRSGNTSEMQAAAMEMRIVYQRAGVKVDGSAFIPPIAQGILGFGMWRLLRTMGYLPVPGLLNGGWGWFTDLSIPDPYYILPLCTAGVLHLVGRIGGESGVVSLGPWQRGLLLWGLPAMSFLFTFLLPATVQVYFAATAVLSQFQSLSLRNPWIRRKLNLTPLYSETTSTGVVESNAPYSYQAPKSVDTTLTSENDKQRTFPWTSPSKWWGSARNYTRDTFTKKENEEERSRNLAIEYEKRRQADIKENKKRARDYRHRPRARRN